MNVQPFSVTRLSGRGWITSPTKTFLDFYRRPNERASASALHHVSIHFTTWAPHLLLRISISLLDHYSIFFCTRVNSFHQFFHESPIYPIVRNPSTTRSEALDLIISIRSTRGLEARVKPIPVLFYTVICCFSPHSNRNNASQEIYSSCRAYAEKLASHH